MASLLRRGSSGSEVRDLQRLLNNYGYGLDVDGIFGDQTYNAVTQYQKKNGLGVDGIVGDQTWGSLRGSGGSSSANPENTDKDTAVTPSTPPSAATPLGNQYNPNETTGSKADLGALEGGAPAFTESQAYKDAMSALQQHQGAKPGAYQSAFSDRLNALYEQIAGRPEYTSPYGDRIEAIYNQVMSRPDFEYDFNADPLYHQYKDQYMAGGQRAMQDTMANAAALTGGYGNSYAATAGQQAYQQHLTGLNNVIPELMDAAYQRYRDQGQDLYDQMQLTQAMDEMAYGRYMDQGQALMSQLQALQGMDETEYGRYRDQIGDYYAQLEYLTGAAGDQWNRDNELYQTALDKWLTDRDYYYGKTQDELAQKNYLDGLEAEKSSGSSGGSSGGSGGGGKKNDSGTQKPKDEPAEQKLTVAEAQNILFQISKSEGITSAAREMQSMIDKGIVEGDDVESKLKYALSMISRR